MKYDHIIIDGNNMARRMFATHKNLYSVVAGKRVSTGLTHGFLKGLIKLKMRFGGKIVIAWDTGIKRRRDVFPEYKAARREKGKEWEDRELFIDSMNFLKWACRNVGLCQVQGPYDEADDVINTYVEMVVMDGFGEVQDENAIVVSNDHDMNQILQSGVHILFQRKGVDKITTLDKFKRQEGINPKLYMNAMALAGDKGDGVPGIPGVGMKTAIGFLKKNPEYIGYVIQGLEKEFEFDYKGAREQKIIDADPQLIMKTLELVALKNIWPLTFIANKKNEDIALFLDRYGLSELASRSDEVEQLV